MRNPREGGCTGAGSLTDWGWRSDRSGQRRQGDPKTLYAPPGWNS
jgi:hypothetical protein